MIEGLKRVVFFGAHSDDEMICAGTLHRLARTGAAVHVVTFACAATESDRKGLDNNMALRTLKPEWDKAMRLIGVAQSNLLAWGPSAQLAEMGQRIADYAFAYVEKHRPDAVFTLSPEDENPAHAVVGTQCERVLRGRVPVTVRCQFPWNFGLGRPNLYVRLEQQDLTAKRAVIQAYQSQHFRYEYEDMLLSYCRGDGLSVKALAAEKFEIVRAVI